MYCKELGKGNSKHMTKSVMAATRNCRDDRGAERGFSLLEVSVVLIVIGLLIVPIIVMYNQYIKSRQIGQTRSAISMVDSALIKYVAKFGRYPIPSDPNIPMGAAGFGQSAVPPAGPWPLCTNPSGGVVCRTNVNTFGGAEVLIGAVPFAEIGIPFNSSLDGYGARFTYAVTSSLTVTATYNEGAGAIEVRNNAGVSRYFSDILPADGTDDLTVPRSHAIIISHGEDGRGAFTLGGLIATPCAGAGRDIENCNNDGLFTNNANAFGNEFRSYGGGANHYDDFVITNNVAASGIWTFIPTTPNMRSAVAGNVNVGNCAVLPCVPKAHVDVDEAVRSVKLKTDRMCSYVESGCVDNFASTYYPAWFGPSMIVGAPPEAALPETLPPAGNNWSAARYAHDGAGIRCVGGRGLWAIWGNDEYCRDSVNFANTVQVPSSTGPATCPAGTFGKGLDAAGKLVCVAP